MQRTSTSTFIPIYKNFLRKNRKINFSEHFPICIKYGVTGIIEGSCSIYLFSKSGELPFIAIPFAYYLLYKGITHSLLATEGLLYCATKKMHTIKSIAVITVSCGLVGSFMYLTQNLNIDFTEKNVYQPIICVLIFVYFTGYPSIFFIKN